MARCKVVKSRRPENEGDVAGENDLLCIAAIDELGTKERTGGCWQSAWHDQKEPRYSGEQENEHKQEQRKSNQEGREGKEKRKEMESREGMKLKRFAKSSERAHSEMRH
jgi:hypothetical protein